MTWGLLVVSAVVVGIAGGIVWRERRWMRRERQRWEQYARKYRESKQ